MIADSKFQSAINLVNTAATPLAVSCTLSVVLVDIYSFMIVGIITVLSLVLFYFYSRFAQHHGTHRITFLAIILGILIGSIFSIDKVDSLDSIIYGEKISLSGVIKTTPEYKEKYQRFIFMPENLGGSNDAKDLLVTTDIYDEYQIGDVVKINGKISAIENFSTENGREFNYVNYLKIKGVGAQVSYATIEKTGDIKSSINRYLSIVKSHYLESLSANLPEPHSSLAGGITVGANDALGQDVDLLFRRVGLTHIVVLSGYNVAIVILALSSALAFLPYWISSGISFMGIWLFVLLVGASPAIIRAGIMASIAVVSRLYGSAVKPISMLSIAVVLMVLNEPLIVMYDPSFQLSVLATIGIIVITPIIEPYFKFVTRKLGFREIIVTTLATQLTVIPWLVYLMGEFSIVSPLANVAVLPFVPWAMASAFLIYVFSNVSTLLTMMMTFISYYLLEYVFTISKLLVQFRLSSLSTMPMSFIYIITVYALVGLFVFKLNKRNQIYFINNQL